jgi:hypothetical protein
VYLELTEQLVRLEPLVFKVMSEQRELLVSKVMLERLVLRVILEAQARLVLLD